MSEESDFQVSDDDIDEQKHKKLIDNILGLNKKQLKKHSRTEPALQISEFNLVKSLTGKNGNVQLDELTKALGSKKKLKDVGQKLQVTKKKAHTLPKPLEKPRAEKIRRSVGYEKNRFLFDRWEAFVTSNRAQSHQVFPLNSLEKIKHEVKQAVKIPETWKIKSDLQKKLEALETPVEEYYISDGNKNEFELTFKELKAKRKEEAKLRALQSYKEAKARRQNKIKSKKYHRILRKEKIKQKLKEFEELQKTNPEEALKKIEEIEKARALERFSLRHKSTGQWAKSKQFRAKYDRESRQMLAEQLKISRDLTQTQKQTEDDSEDDTVPCENEVAEFVNNIKKFQERQNTEVQEAYDDNTWVNTHTKYNKITDNLTSYQKIWRENLDVDNMDTINKDDNAESIKGPPKKMLKKQCTKSPKNQINLQVKTKLKQNNHDVSSGDWDIDVLFDHAEKKVEGKLKGQKKKSKVEVTKQVKTKLNQDKKKVNLSLPSQKKNQVLDEQMIEMPVNEADTSDSNKSVEQLKGILKSSFKSNNSKIETNASQNINPEAKLTMLESATPDLDVDEEDMEENNLRHIIMDSFEDNDIVEHFYKEKQNEIEMDKPETIDLNLPGWGSWAGTAINPKKQRKRRRFIVKMPEVLPRRDDNKGSLIINEKAAAKIKPHLVSAVPFPFKTVKDYEASVRAPIGNTFVPELAFRKFIRPAVETKMGTIIEPVTTNVLMGTPKK